MGLTGSRISSTLATKEAQDGLHPLYFIEFGKESVIDVLLSDEFFKVDDNFYSYLSKMEIATTTLSVSAIFLDLLLFLHLAIDMDNRWQFFPIFTQLMSDIIGPGIANIFHDPIAGYEKRQRELRGSVGLEFYSIITLKTLWNFIDYESPWSCVLTYLRVYLNEFCTVTCVCATAWIRYMFVCQPTFEMTREIFIRVAFAVFALVLLLLGAISLDFTLNNKLEKDELFEDKLPVTYFLSALHEMKRDYNSGFVQSARIDQNSSSMFYNVPSGQVVPFGSGN